MKITFRVHAVQRMFEWRIGQKAVERAIKTGQVIKKYDDDRPFPSRLILCEDEGRPMHVVVAYNKANDEEIVITVYEPDPQRWDPGFRRKLK